MSYIIEPLEIQEKQKQIEPYLIGAGKFKEGTPEYIIQLHEEVLDFYRRETNGVQ